MLETTTTGLQDSKLLGRIVLHVEVEGDERGRLGALVHGHLVLIVDVLAFNEAFNDRSLFR